MKTWSGRMYLSVADAHRRAFREPRALIRAAKTNNAADLADLAVVKALLTGERVRPRMPVARLRQR